MRKDKSMLDEAYDIVTENGQPMVFADLVSEVAANLEMSDEEKLSRLGAFYTDLSLDGRFVALTDNTWDLRIRHTYDKVHINVNEVYSDDSEEEENIDKEELEGEDEETTEYSDEEGPSRKIDLEGTGIKEEDL